MYFNNADIHHPNQMFLLEDTPPLVLLFA